MGNAALKFRGNEYMPIRLKGILIEAGISQPRLARSVIQKNGVPISGAAISLLINWNYWPRSTPEQDIKAQIEKFLRASGVTEDEIRSAWDMDSSDPYRTRHPVGSHPNLHPHPHKAEQAVKPVEIEMLSPKAKRHFKLFRDPFQDDVNGPDDVFLSDEQRYVAEAMFQTARNGGFLAVPGESGSGKTTLRKMLLERIKGHPIRVIFPRSLDKTRLSTGNICQAIINDIAPGVSVKSSLEAQARQVESLLMQSGRADNVHVLVIEEAHDLSIATLKYLKRFYELEDGFRKLLSIILIGQQELKEKLDEGRHPEAREVIRRCEIAELRTLDNDLEKYLTHKFRRINVDPAAIFDQDVYDGIRDRLSRSRPGRDRISQLYPLTVNNLVTKAMNRAAELGLERLNADLMRAM